PAAAGVFARSARHGLLLWHLRSRSRRGMASGGAGNAALNGPAKDVANSITVSGSAEREREKIPALTASIKAGNAPTASVLRVNSCNSCKALLNGGCVRVGALLEDKFSCSRKLVCLLQSTENRRMNDLTTEENAPERPSTPDGSGKQFRPLRAWP